MSRSDSRLLLLCLWFAFSSCLYLRRLPTPRPLRLNQQHDAQVFDGITSLGVCERLSEYLLQKKPGFAVFDRECLSDASEVELFIDSVLNKLNDDSRFVEYWHVSRWISHDMHRDVDEKSCFELGIQLHPRNGHVLYLSLDPWVASTGGATVVLTEDKSKMFVCPPAPGRLLRFNGTLLHGVPRPGLEYFLNAQSADELAALPVIKPFIEKGWPSLESFARPKGKDTDADVKPLARVNLLFNTWPEKPPLDSPLVQEEDRRVQTDTLKGVRCATHSWETKPLDFVPPATHETLGDQVLEMLIGLPADRRRRDSYDTSISLETYSSATEAFIVPPFNLSSPHPNPPRVISVRSKEEE